MKKVIFTTIIFLYISTVVIAQGVVLAEWPVYPDSFEVTVTDEERLLSRLVLDHIGLPYREGFRGSWESPYFADFEIGSSLEAVQYSEMELFNYLIYGSVQKSADFYRVSLTLFDGRARKELALITVESAIESETALAHLVSERIITFMLLNGYLLHDEEPENPVSDVSAIDATVDSVTYVQQEPARYNPAYFMALSGSVGYPLPISWWPVITGLVNVEVGLKAVNLTFYQKEPLTLGVRPGLTIAYQVAINKPGRVESYYNSLLLRLPVELCFELAGRHCISVGTGVQGRLDILYRSEPFSPGETEVSGAFGLLAMTGYQYYIFSNKRLAIGVNSLFDFSFYNRFYAGYSFEVTVLYRLGERR